MCYGKTGGSWPVIFIVPNPAALAALAQSVGSPVSDTSDLAALCKCPKVVAAMTKQMQSTCKGAKLVAFEIPQRLGLCAEPWTPENELLTAQLKLKRPQIVKHLAKEIGEMYG